LREKGSPADCIRRRDKSLVYNIVRAISRGISAKLGGKSGRREPVSKKRGDRKFSKKIGVQRQEKENDFNSQKSSLYPIDELSKNGEKGSLWGARILGKKRENFVKFVVGGVKHGVGKRRKKNNAVAGA